MTRPLGVALVALALGCDDTPVAMEDLSIPPDMTGVPDLLPGPDLIPLPANCENYCDTIMGNCTSAYAQYPDKPTCLKWCRVNYGWPISSPKNDVTCRNQKATLAAAGRKNCTPAGPTGGDSCGSFCENYCYLALRNCHAESGAPWGESMEACMASCESIDVSTGDPNDTTGNNIYCRIYYLGLAGESISCCSLNGDQSCCPSQAAIENCPKAKQPSRLSTGSQGPCM